MKVVFKSRAASFGRNDKNFGLKVTLKFLKNNHSLHFPLDQKKNFVALDWLTAIFYLWNCP